MMMVVHGIIVAELYLPGSSDDINKQNTGRQADREAQEGLTSQAQYPIHWCHVWEYREARREMDGKYRCLILSLLFFL